MKFWKKFTHLFSKKDDLQKIPEDANKIYSADKERLIFTEQQSRSADEQILTEIPKEEIKLIEQEILAKRRLKMQQTPTENIAPEQKEENSNRSSFEVSTEIFPKKCRNCPDHKKYFEGEIHQCPDCGAWICGRHFHGHVLKFHKSTEYTILGSDSGSGSYKIK